VKNVTVSGDEKLIAKARAYAQAHHTTLNQLIRDYLSRITGQRTAAEAAEEFAALARSHAGRSPESWTFDRADVHRRGEAS
jgi:hypothetical protein